ncbi:DUF3278 domain-containing protein [Levilactobacillus acidifarinae]|uniref:DUF3278 domain-containing protein n=1 Tax=Levilactobacillus acidifarinae DSM 19394 = JCM 15949 TaxID=1423715 RepID=A0A0R1LLK0_9LACO|nr:DUF3278 domain-containing protein [Levilactobacillus acidifarinae]KRK96687.1 hypothetical protein FD25_GL001766 [Levilactobacillus acidifarinae DSM 19394]GEO70384.1 hypothetical protein LAC03_22940 [Levilactobacillus acidifarinae]
MGKSSLYVRLVKRFYGIDDVLDEYKLQQINHLGNVMFLWLMGYLMIGNLALMVAIVKAPAEQVLTIAIFVNLLVVASVIGVLIGVTRKLKLDDVEVAAADLPQRVKRLRWRAVGAGFYFFCWMLLIQSLLDWWVDGTSLAATFTSLGFYGTGLGGGVFFGVWMYVVWRLHLKIVD